MRSRWCCTRKFVPHGPCRRGKRRDGMANIVVAALPTCSVGCSRKPDDTSPKSRHIAPRPTSQTTCWMSPLAIPKPTPFTVLDNLSSHTRKAVVERFGEKRGGWLWGRFTVHYTPKHGSWLNQAEIAISLFSRQCLSRRRIADRATLRKETRAWSRRMNRHRAPIQWGFSRKKARHVFDYTITRSQH